LTFEICLSYKIVDLKDNKIIFDVNSKKITVMQEEKESLEAEVAKLKESLTDPAPERVSIEQFLNLSKNAGTAVQNGCYKRCNLSFNLFELSFG